MDVIIEGNVYFRGRFTKCCVGIENEKIVKVKKVMSKHDADEYYDFGDKLILPAGIDVHVHFRDPGLTHKEDFETGSMAAGYGGVSCVFDMPNTEPRVRSAANFIEKLQIVRKKSYVDFGLYAEYTESTASIDCSGFKLYFGETTGSGTPSIPDHIKTDKVVAVHCEDDRFIKKIESKTLIEHSRARPPESELSAVKKSIQLNVPKLRICHISVHDSLNIVKGSKVTTEVTPHHLLLNYDADLGAFGKVNPPLRSKEEQEKLWSAFAGGEIDILASDHAPHTIDEKKMPFHIAPSGVPGVETMIPLMLMKVRTEKLSMSQLITAVAEKPANLFSIMKGRIEIGYDADIIVVDMRKVRKIRNEDIHSKCAWTPFENFDAIFPVLTMVRGNIVIEDYELVGNKGTGRFVWGSQNISSI